MFDNLTSTRHNSSDYQVFFKEYTKEDEQYLLYMLSSETKKGKK